MALVPVATPAGDVESGWRSAAVDCKTVGCQWLGPTASGASVLAFCGGEHSTAPFGDGVHFLAVDAEGNAVPATLRRDGVAWPRIAPDSVVGMARVGDVEGHGLLLAGSDGTLRLLGVSVVESGGDAVHRGLLDLLVRHAGTDAEVWQTLQNESIASLRQRAVAAGLDVSATHGQIETAVHANSRQDYAPAFLPLCCWRSAAASCV